jgi:hypothetical protein
MMAGIDAGSIPIARSIFSSHVMDRVLKYHRPDLRLPECAPDKKISYHLLSSYAFFTP